MSSPKVTCARDDRRPRDPVRDPARGPAVQGDQQGAEEEGNLEADQRELPSLRHPGNGHLRRQADVHGLQLRTRAGLSICVDDMLVPTQKVDHHRDRRARSEGNREAVHLGSGDPGRTLQQGGRHLGTCRRPGGQGDDGAARHQKVTDPKGKETTRSPSTPST